MTTRNNRAARGNAALPTWPVHDAALAVMPVLVRAELHLRRLAGNQADARSRRLLQLFESQIEIAGDVESHSRQLSDPALVARAAPLAAALAAYERAGENVASAQRRCGHDPLEPQRAAVFAALIVRETDGTVRINAGATWEHACTAVATGAAVAGWQAATAPATVLRAALAVANDDGWWTGPGDHPVHVSASSLLAVVKCHQALIEAVERLLPAADAHATDAMILADDPDASTDEQQARRRHATETDLDIGFARSTLQHAKGMR